MPQSQLVVDARGVMVTANQAARRTFDIQPGDVGRLMNDLALWNTHIDLGSTIDRVFRERRPFTAQAVEFPRHDGASRVFDIHVSPLIDDDSSVVGTSVSFVDVTHLTQLRAEIELSRQDVESAYQELQSSNEQLQSSNEELETMNDELQSSNAELRSINTGLRLRTDELNTLLRAIAGNIELAMDETKAGEKTASS